jgi:integrase
LRLTTTSTRHWRNQTITDRTADGHLRYGATLLKNLGVPGSDAQIILGHSRLAVTLEIYTHEDRQAQRQALGRISEVLGHCSEPSNADTADRKYVSNMGVNAR